MYSQSAGMQRGNKIVFFYILTHTKNFSLFKKGTNKMSTKKVSNSAKATTNNKTSKVAKQEAKAVAKAQKVEMAKKGAVAPSPVQQPAATTPKAVEAVAEVQMEFVKTADERILAKHIPAKVEVVDINEVPIGSVVCYESSEKPYILTAKDEKGRMLFSKTQAYFSTAKKFNVKVVKRGEGTLPVSFQEPALNELLSLAKADLEQRQAKMQAQAQKRAEAQEKADKVKAELDAKLKAKQTAAITETTETAGAALPANQLV